uniref:Uncharacterized protein n=1 Tax=Oryza punctata TaxID=4537 RepID=A0A0E0L9Q7_ORYPU
MYTLEYEARCIFGRVSNKSKSVEKLCGQWQPVEIHTELIKLAEEATTQAKYRKDEGERYNEKDTRIEVEAKKEKRVCMCAPNQRFASNHQVLSPPHYLYSSPISSMSRSWNPLSGMFCYPS